jgi:hypothetical protein
MHVGAGHWPRAASGLRRDERQIRPAEGTVFAAKGSMGGLPAYSRVIFARVLSDVGLIRLFTMRAL